ncbi:MAG: hypothetical protein M3O34_12975 [Chloroflexota bacterium]|nr:hypothetical protein [Chloroflexota bacterium]
MMTSGNILLLDDEPSIRDLVADVLAEGGHRVRVCESPEQVLDAADLDPATLAVVDFWGQSHQELAAEERAEVLRLAQAVPTVLVTARTWARDEMVDALGLRALIRKPFDVDELATVVNEALDSRRRGGMA